MTRFVAWSQDLADAEAEARGWTLFDQRLVRRLVLAADYRTRLVPMPSHSAMATELGLGRSEGHTTLRASLDRLEADGTVERVRRALDVGTVYRAVVCDQETHDERTRKRATHLYPDGIDELCAGLGFAERALYELGLTLTDHAGLIRGSLRGLMAHARVRHTTVRALVDRELWAAIEGGWEVPDHALAARPKLSVSRAPLKGRLLAKPPTSARETATTARETANRPGKTGPY